MCFFICVVSHRDEKSAAAQNEGERGTTRHRPHDDEYYYRRLPRAEILFYAFVLRRVKPFDDDDANKKTERERFSKSRLEKKKRRFERDVETSCNNTKGRSRSKPRTTKRSARGRRWSRRAARVAGNAHHR